MLLFVSIYSTSCSAYQLEALLVQETLGKESRLERAKRGIDSPVNKEESISHRNELVPKCRENEGKGFCFSHISPRRRNKEIKPVLWAKKSDGECQADKVTYTLVNTQECWLLCISIYMHVNNNQLLFLRPKWGWHLNIFVT